MGENRCESRRERNRQSRVSLRISWQIYLFPGQPDFRFHGPQNFWRKIEKSSDADHEDDQGKDGIEMHQSQSGQDRSVFAKTQPNVRKGFWRRVAGETRRRFCSVSDEARAAGKQSNDYRKRRTRMT